MVTIQSLKANGYPVSTLKDETVIALAEKDVKLAYFPSTETFSSQSVIELLHALVYSLLLRRKLTLTRYGSVSKVSQYSIAAEEEAITSEIRSCCTAKLESYYQSVTFDCLDILKIYDKLFLV